VSTPQRGDWALGSAAISIDADFFAEAAEQRLVKPLARWLEHAVSAGAPVDVSEYHSDYHLDLTGPVDLTINFDFHMDMRIEFLFGDRPRACPASGSGLDAIGSSCA